MFQAQAVGDLEQHQQIDQEEPPNSQNVPSDQAGPGTEMFSTNGIRGTDVSPNPEKSSNSPISAQSMATPNSARRAGDNRGVTATKNNWDCASSRRCYGSPLSVSGSMPRAK